MQRVIAVVLRADGASSLRGQLMLAARSVEDFDRSATRAAASANTMGTAMKAALIGAAAAVAAGLAFATKSAAEFDAAMRNVNSISGLSEQALGALQQKVLALSRSGEVTQSATTLAKGLYDIASSGFQGAEGMTVLTAAAKAATAGLSDTATASKAITAVLNAYGLEADQAAHVSDVLFQTVNLGVLTFGDLAQNLGDVVGITSAAGISIEEVGAAIAAMTRAGVPASEAFTSLNQLVQKLIKPSDELAAVYRALGIDILPALRDPAIGLHGVLEKLRVATGGNVEAFLKLFPEVRAARGAFTALAAEGNTLKEMYKGMQQAGEGVGATQRALNEQLKSLSAQWKIFTNQIEAASIELGSRLLPVFLGLIRGIQDLGSDIARFLSEGGRLRPLLSALADTGRNFAQAISEAAAGLGPLIAFLAQLAGTAAIGALMGLAEGLSVVSGFLADHPGLVQALVIAYGVHLVAALAQTAAGFVGLQIGRVSFLLAELAVQVKAAAVEWGAFGAAVRGVAFAAGIAAGVIGMIALANATTRAVDQAKGLSKEFERGLDTTSVDGLTKAIGRANFELDRLEESRGWAVTDVLMGWLELLTPLPNTVYDTGIAIRDTNKRVEEYARTLVQTAENSNAVAHATGLSRQSVEAYAKALGVDLSQGFKASEGARAKLTTDINRLRQLVGPAAEELLKAGEEGAKAFLDLAQAAEEAQAAASKAFTKDFDLIAGFGTRAKEHQAALAGLADAQRAVATTGGDAASEAVRLAEAQQRVRDTDLGSFFSDTLAEAKAFASGLQDAAKRGLDPLIIKQLLEAGPKAAAPVLEAIAADSSGAYIRQFNDLQTALRGVSEQIIEVAALTQRRISSTSTEVTANFGLAMDILREKAKQGAGATVESVATGLGILPGKVEEVMKMYEGAFTLPMANAATDAAAKAGETRDNIKNPLWEAENEAGRALGIIPSHVNTHLGTAAGNATTKAGETRNNIVGPIWDAQNQTGQALGNIPGQVNTHLNTAVVQAGRLSGNIADGLIGGVRRGTTETSTMLSNWAGGATGVLNSVLSQLISPEAFASAAKDAGSLLAAANGMFLPREAAFARGGTLVQWAEPETGGEWFLPDAPAKRDRSVALAEKMLEGWGYRMERFAVGGQRGGTDNLGLPYPPDYRPWWTWPTADIATVNAYEKTHAWLTGAIAEIERRKAEAAAKAAAAVGGGAPYTGGDIGSGWQQITGYLDSKGVGYTITSTTGGIHAVGSYHYQGKAVDLVGDLGSIFATLAAGDPVPGINELFYDPAGYYYDNGARYAGAIGGHGGHVHAATFDRGGWLLPGLTLANNTTGRPERVTPSPSVVWSGSHGGSGSESIDYDRLCVGIAREIAKLPQPVLEMDRRRVGEVVSSALQDRRNLRR